MKEKRAIQSAFFKIYSFILRILLEVSVSYILLASNVIIYELNQIVYFLHRIL
jgi:hypothetical protein